MISSIISRLVILLFGTLYPAYASYKAVKTKNVKEYVKWMMYWIVFALFTCAETFTDVFLSWFPFYYEIKIVIVIWLLSPATKGSSILYRKFVHPMLSSREQEIDEYISKAKEQSYKQVLDIGQKGVTVLMQTAIKSGGGLVNQLKKSYSLSDLNDTSDNGQEETDLVPLRITNRKSPHRSSTTTSMYFPEIDVRPQQEIQVQSIDDLSSGYSSGEALSMSQSVKIQGRAPISVVGSLTRSKSSRVTRSTTVPKKTSDGEVSDDDNEVYDTNVIFLNDKCQHLNKLSHNESSSENEFYDSTDKLHVTLEVKENNNNSCKNLLTACKKTVVNENVSLEKLNDIEKLSSCRGGKYNKKAAPKPPEKSKDLMKNDDVEGIIKGTLVLNPGKVRTNVACDDKCKDVFLHLPKRRINKYFISPKKAFDACSKNRLESNDKDLKRDVSFPSLIENHLLESQSMINLNNMQFVPLSKISNRSKISLNSRFRLNLLKSKSIHMDKLFQKS